MRKRRVEKKAQTLEKNLAANSKPSLHYIHRRTCFAPFLQTNIDSSSTTPTTGTIVKANLTSLNIRPASGRAFVRVSFCGGRSLTTSKMHSQLNSIPSIPAASWLGQYEDQPFPGGGSA